MTPEIERELREFLALHPDGKPTTEELWEAAWTVGIAYETSGYHPGDKSYRELEEDLEDANDEITGIKQELAALKWPNRVSLAAVAQIRVDIQS
jgi:hypothetical protein